MSNGKILVAGGGIGGLTASLCLAAKGYSVEVFEQAGEFVEIGAGIQLSPNCSRVLHSLGLEDVLRASAFLPSGSQFRNWKTGRVIAESKLGDEVVERFGAPYYHMHRGDLLRVLVEAARQSDRIALHLDTRAVGFQQSAEGVRLLTVDAEHEGQALIGADGIHSEIRTGLWGAESPRFTGTVAWRALVAVDRLPEGLIRPMSTVWWGPRKHFVHYYVRRGTLVNCVCVVEKKGWDVESWTERGDYDELKADFAGWHDDLQQLIDTADRDSLFKWALYDRAPMPRWGKGRVTLLGDACHPTLPFMAQGAAMAIEDAAVLAGCLASSEDVGHELARYENLRRDRTAEIQKGSRRNATVFHLSGVRSWLRNRAAQTARRGTMDRLFSYDALRVVEKAENN